MTDINNTFATLLKVALKGSDEALQRAYRHSIRMLAEYDMEFGSESQPRELDFRWEWIDGYRVLTVLTDGAGITGDFSEIPEIEECVWLLYDGASATAITNDTQGILLNHRHKFSIPANIRFEIQ